MEVVMEQQQRFAGFVADDLPPVIACELTALGWRGLTEDGEILNVKGMNGAPVRPSESLSIISAQGRELGFRAVKPSLSPPGLIECYSSHFSRAAQLMRSNEAAAALDEANAAVALAPTLRARFNRAFILLALGRWREGFAEYADCEQHPLLMRPLSRVAIGHGLRLWQGEDIAGKRLLLIHDHGFGDSIMALRYVATLKAMGADVLLLMPRELERLAAQCAPVIDDFEDADYFCSMLLLLHALAVMPDNIPLAPYLRPDLGLVEKWRKHIDRNRKTIGLAWSVGVTYANDYPRAIPVEMLAAALAGIALYSVQIQEAYEAERCGIASFPFEDFADCAAFMAVLDEIVSIDTAALHLAGAIGHKHITALLSHWASWRWLSPWYENITFCRQRAPGDWQGALAQL
jgi:hypothetical protein